MKRLFLLILTLSIFAVDSPEESVNIWLIGDSTMFVKPDPEHNLERGWEQMVPRFFSETVMIHNHARNGRSTKSFIEEGR